jgi:hypothetical protein
MNRRAYFAGTDVPPAQPSPVKRDYRKLGNGSFPDDDKPGSRLRRGPEYLAVLVEERDRGGRGFLDLAVLGGLHAVANAGREAVFVG